MDPQKWREAIQAFASALEIQSLKQVFGQLSPDEVLAKAEQSLRTQFKEVLTEVLLEADSSFLEKITDGQYDSLNDSDVIEAITPPLATDLGQWLREEGEEGGREALLDALVRNLIDEEEGFDLEELKELVAEKVANRLQIASGD
ncbi:MAG: hypothetical protein MUP45_01675 [Candidatus Marinimicrobia bacterium]|nr:hypothetical protein [Candidatus Neomarinimicrobiota bacterium]